MTVMLGIPAVASAMEVDIPYQQTFKNNSAESSVADTFDYQLTVADAASPMPEGSSNGAYEFSLEGNVSGLLNLNIDYPKPGYYHYTVRSKVDKPKKGYTYSSKTYTVTVMVINGTNGLETGAIIIQDSKSTKYDKLIFKTRYHKKRPGGGDGTNGNSGDGVTPPEVPLDDIGDTESGNDNPAAFVNPDNPEPVNGEDYWALINLICMLLTWLTAILGGILYIRRRRQADGDQEPEEMENPQKLRRKGWLRGGAAVVAILSLILFILTEDMTLPMRLVDEWTIWMIVLLAIAVLLALISRKVTEDNETNPEG